jgi:hypothetical protein
MKSQSEIFGMAIVMVLVTIGLLMFVVFALNSSSSRQSLTTQYVHKQLPVLLNDAILQTHALENECYGQKIKDLLIKCGQRDNFVCNNNQNACDFSKKFISSRLNETLEKWKMEYSYTVFVGTDLRSPDTSVIFNLNNSRCLRDVSSETFFFRMSNGRLLNMKMDICT